MTTETPAGRELLSNRLRPDVECAPWVIEEVRKLEAMIHQGREDERQAQGWRPLDTAPEGQRVLVAYPRFKPESCSEAPDWIDVLIACKDRLGWDSAAWRLHETPVGWMPLPAAPTGGSET